MRASKWLVVVLLLGLLATRPVAGQSVPFRIALSGTAAPDGGTYSGFGAFGPILNSSGQVAFTASLTGGSSGAGIFAGSAGSVQTVALLGNTAAAGGIYDTIGMPVLNDAGQVAFVAGTIDGNSRRSGIFAGVPGAVQAVALSGTATPAGGTYSSFDSGQSSGVRLSGSGQMALVAGLTDS